MKTKKNKKEMFLFNIEKYTRSDLEISFRHMSFQRMSHQELLEEMNEIEEEMKILTVRISNKLLFLGEVRAGLILAENQPELASNLLDRAILCNQRREVHSWTALCHIFGSYLMV